MAKPFEIFGHNTKVNAACEMQMKKHNVKIQNTMQLLVETHFELGILKLRDHLQLKDLYV